MTCIVVGQYAASAEDASQMRGSFVSASTEFISEAASRASGQRAGKGGTTGRRRRVHCSSADESIRRRGWASWKCWLTTMQAPVRWPAREGGKLGTSPESAAVHRGARPRSPGGGTPPGCRRPLGSSTGSARLGRRTRDARHAATVPLQARGGRSSRGGRRWTYLLCSL